MTEGIDPIKPLKVISASAGTGKTSRLSREYVDGLKRAPGETQLGRGIIATTFTNKAADELVERVRRMLLQEGEWEAAQGVLTGYLGTVNSICGRLVSEHAIEAGLSPDFSVISEEQLPAVFAVAVDSVIHHFSDEVDSAATRLQIDWRNNVRDIIDYARNNDLGAKLLEGFAETSWTRLKTLLPPLKPEQSEQVLDESLAIEVEKTLSDLQRSDDKGEMTQRAVDHLTEVNRSLKAGRVLHWQAWAKLCRLSVNSTSAMLMKGLSDIGNAHVRHPRLHDDLRTTIFGVFRCAAAALLEYTRFKREHGLIDFVDQEHLALRILKQPDVRSSFQERARVLLVDEFQDTSPIQLSVFLEMARLVDYSVWVGDEKQSIFGFRGSDPELMRLAVSQLVQSTGARRTRLRRSYRSRPSLVRFANELFVRSAHLMQIDPQSAVIDEIERQEVAGQRDPLHLWWLQGNRNEQALQALAQAISEMLARPQEWPVVDRETKDLRAIRGSDIAVLCRWNSSRFQVAKALSAQGLTIATERNALLDTAECMLAMATLRFLVDETDTLALAEIANFLEDDDSGGWLNSWLTGRREAVEERLPAISALTAARTTLSDRTPSEVLEIAIAHGGVVETAMSWGNLRQRLANLDAMRGLAKTFEELSLSAKTPATATGLIMYLHEKIRDGGNQPANPDENGIHILTYHKAKGLEWPLVILYDLDASDRGSPFGITVESPEEGMDPLEPLAGRSIRYWPWPYGGQRLDLGLDLAVARTPESRRSGRRSTAENLRLLYVGMTRARDYLILAARPTRGKFRSGTAWLDALVDSDELKILTLPFGNAPVSHVNIIDGVIESRTTVEIKAVPLQLAQSAQYGAEVFAAVTPDVSFRLGSALSIPSYHLQPSTACDTDFVNVDGLAPETIDLGSRLTLAGNPDMKLLGDCVHAFLSTDRLDEKMETRLERAVCALKCWQVDALSAASLLDASDRLHRFIKEQFPGAELTAEVPISGRVGLRRVNGSIDLLLECADGLVIIDHKTFPGRHEEWTTRALTYRHQLSLYRYLLEEATGKRVIAQYIHMPIVGAMIRLDCAMSLGETEAVRIGSVPA